MADEWRHIPGNEHAYNRLREVLATEEAIAFVGAGASSGLYPLWAELIRQLADEAVKQGVATKADRAFWLASTTKPQQAVQSIKQALRGAYRDALRRIFAPRPGADGNYFTAAHGLLVRLAFRGFVTTNYDRGLIAAQQKLRTDIQWGVSFATWKDHDSVHGWLNGTVFREHPYPILFAHGIYERGDTVVLGVDEYRQAYNSGPFRQLFDKLWGQSRLVFVGFGFSDPWLDFIADSVITQTAASMASSPQHIAIIGLKESEEYSIQQRRHFREAYNADPLFYPIAVAPDGAEDHSALLAILEALTREGGTIRTDDEHQRADAEARRTAEEDRRRRDQEEAVDKRKAEDNEKAQLIAAAEARRTAKEERKQKDRKEAEDKRKGEHKEKERRRADAEATQSNVDARPTSMRANWSSVRDLQLLLMGPIAAPKLEFEVFLEPSGKRSKRPRMGLRWSYVLGAAAYRLESSVDESFSRPMEAYVGMKTTWLPNINEIVKRHVTTAEGLMRFVPHYYRVRAISGSLSSPWSNVVMYGNGVGYYMDGAEADKWYRKAADQGNPDAQYNLGRMYENGLGVSKDDTEAVKLYRKAADQGHVDAQYNLGWMYLNGRGVAKDDAEAVKWYRKAADQGDADVQYYLGRMYENGQGVAKDDAEAVKWYRKAADQGHVDAQNNLGRMYENMKKGASRLGQ